MKGKPDSSTVKRMVVSDVLDALQDKSGKRHKKTPLKHRKGGSPSSSPKKSVKTVKGILKRKHHDTTIGCTHKRRITFHAVDHDDATGWKINEKVELDPSRGLDTMDLLSMGIITEEERDLIQAYKGFCPIFHPLKGHEKSEMSSLDLCLPTIDLTERENERTFFDNFVMNRIPAKLTGPVRGAMWAMEADQDDQLDQWTDLNYLKIQAGCQKVAVERAIEDPSTKTGKCKKKEGKQKHSFGHGRRETMAFGAFLDLLSSNDESVYLSAQPTENTLFPKSLIHTPLTSPLIKDFVLRPKAVGPLLPHRYNIWMGHSRDSTTGLHVDVHDNLYRLISGKKTFRLYSPAFLCLIGLRGKIEDIFDNGLPVFEGHEPIRADGSSRVASKVWRMCETIKNRFVLCSLEQGGQPIRIPVKWIHPMNLWQDDASENMDDCHAIMTAAAKKGKKAEDKEQVYPDHFARRNTMEHKQYKNTKKVDKIVLREHLNLAAMEDKLRHFILRELWVDVTLEAGENLYLPAGWAHEVISSSSPSNEPHIALNYWFHPPATVGNLELPDRGPRPDLNQLIETLMKKANDAKMDEQDSSGDAAMEDTNAKPSGAPADGSSSDDDCLPEKDKLLNASNLFKTDGDDSSSEDHLCEDESYDEEDMMNPEGNTIAGIVADETPAGLYCDGFIPSLYGQLKRRLAQMMYLM